MKKVVSMLVLLAIAGTMSAQSQMAQRKFQIIVENERNIKKVQDTNNRISELQEAAREESQRSLFLADLLWKGYTSAFKQKTINASQNLVSLGLSYITESFKSKQKDWYRRALDQCFYHKTLSTESQINDFYALPSIKGAMDPENLKFEGFGCKNYIEVGDSKKGTGIFYVFCKMRRDSVGLRHIVNHSKFLVEIDSLLFYPKYCNLPNDSTGSVESRFSFEKRDNLNLELKARFYSSWMNQATMITEEQLLGEFTINVDVDKNKLNKDSMFIYDKKDPDFNDLVSIEGDCFLVPRSYTGTMDGKNYQPSWGTGQYRIEMEVSERCNIVDSYYQIRKAGKGEIVAATEGTPQGDHINSEKWKWDKAKWKVEWKAMKVRKKNTPFYKNVWKGVISAYKGNGWMATFTDPAATALYEWEAKEIGEWIDEMHDKVFPNEKE